MPTFSTATVTTADQGAASGWNQRNHRLARDSSGNLWCLVSNSTGTTYNLYKSIDGGVNWTDDGQIGGTNSASQRGYGLTISADDTLYMWWRDGTTDYVIKRNSAGSWTTKFSSVTVQSDEATSRLLAHPTIAANLYLCMGREVGGGAQGLTVIYSEDTGGSWTAVDVTLSGFGGGFHIYSQAASDFAMATDGTIHGVGIPCLTSPTGYPIEHRTFDTVSHTWGGSDRITNGLGSGNFDKFVSPSLALDSNNKVHLLAYANDSVVGVGSVYQAHYFTNASGSWSTLGVYPYGAANASYNQFFKQIFCIGTAPVVVGAPQGYGTNSTHQNLVMYSKESGSWVQTIVVDSTTDYRELGGIESGGRARVSEQVTAGYYFLAVPGSTSDPQYFSSSTLTWNTGITSGIKNFNSLVYASAKTFNSIAIASVKSRDELT